ncbi:MAG: SH3 domain-containing protein [Bdellovibrionales bacterium]
MLAKLLIFTIFITYWHQISAQNAVPAQVDSVPVSLESALKLHQEKKYLESIEVLQKLSTDELAPADIQFNLALNYIRLQQLGPGYGHLRQALGIQTGHSPSLNLLSKLDTNQAQVYHLKKDAFDKFSMSLHYRLGMAPILILVVISIYILVRRILIAVKDGQTREDQYNSWRNVGIISVLFLLFVSILSIKWNLSNKSLATITTPNLDMRLTAKENSPSTGTLVAGEEVMVLRKKEEWIQIMDFKNRRAWIRETDLMRLNQ